MRPAPGGASFAIRPCSALRSQPGAWSASCCASRSAGPDPPVAVFSVNELGSGIARSGPAGLSSTALTLRPARNSGCWWGPLTRRPSSRSPSHQITHNSSTASASVPTRMNPIVRFIRGRPPSTSRPLAAASAPMSASGAAARRDCSRKRTPGLPASAGRTRATDSRQRPRRARTDSDNPSSHQSTRLALKSHPCFSPRAGVAGYGCARDVLVRQPEPMSTARASHAAATGTLPRQRGGRPRITWLG